MKFEISCTQLQSQRHRRKSRLRRSTLPRPVANRPFGHQRRLAKRLRHNPVRYRRRAKSDRSPVGRLVDGNKLNMNCDASVSGLNA